MQEPIHTFLVMIAGHVFHIKESRLHPSAAQEFLDSGGPTDPGQVDGAAGKATVVGILLVFQGDAQQRRDQKVSIQRKDGTDLGKVEDIASRPKRHVSVQDFRHPRRRERLFYDTFFQVPRFLSGVIVMNSFAKTAHQQKTKS